MHLGEIMKMGRQRIGAFLGRGFARFRKSTARRPGSLAFDLLEDRTVPTVLSLSIAPSTFAENAGAAAATGTVTRSDTDFSAPLTVTLTSSDTTEAVAPAQVVVPAGAASVDFPID